MRWKEHDDYIITTSLPVDNREIVLGVHQQQGGQFATWECCDGEYCWAHYFTNELKATEDLCRRVLKEIQDMKHKEFRYDDRNIGCFLKNGSNRAFLEFPTNDLQDILGSIGITEGADKVCLNGKYEIALEPAGDKFADALIHVLGEQDSLHTVNEVAMAAYHSEYRVYLMLEENLKKGKYHSADQLLNDAAKRKEQLKKKAKKEPRR